jgi:hypothetical protein
VLDSVWNARTEPEDRALIAPALAVLWPHLDRTDAASRAHKTATYLDGALRNPNVNSDEFRSLALVLPPVCKFLELAEQRQQANSTAEVLIGSLNNQKHLAAYVTPALATMSVHLDQAGVIRLADQLFALMEQSKIQSSLSDGVPTTDVDPVLEKVAVRLDERDLRRLLIHPLAVGSPQRILLDALPASRKRSFRNLWHYLDWTQASGK